MPGLRAPSSAAALPGPGRAAENRERGSGHGLGRAAQDKLKASGHGCESQEAATQAVAHLDLLLGAGGDVRDGPARFLLDALLVAGGQQVEQAGQRAAVDDDLGWVGVGGRGGKATASTAAHHPGCAGAAAQGGAARALAANRVGPAGWRWHAGRFQPGARGRSYSGGMGAHTCVCMSSPVTMLPTVRSAGTSTLGDWWLQGRAVGEHSCQMSVSCRPCVPSGWASLIPSACSWVFDELSAA